jgi:hypothetical protein
MRVKREKGKERKEDKGFLLQNDDFTAEFEMHVKLTDR